MLRKLSAIQYLYVLLLVLRGMTCTQESCTRNLHNKHGWQWIRYMKPAKNTVDQSHLTFFLFFCHARFVRQIELCSIRCKKPVQYKTCAKKHDTHSRNLCKFLVLVSGTRFLSVCVTPINCFRRIFQCCWRERTRPLQFYCKSLPLTLLIDQRKLLLWLQMSIWQVSSTDSVHA